MNRRIVGLCSLAFFVALGANVSGLHFEAGFLTALATFASLVQWWNWMDERHVVD